MTVIVVGNAAVDTTFEVSRLPRPGESILASAVREDLGGKGLNQAVAAARAGAHVMLNAAVGDDPAAVAIEVLLRGESMATHGLVRASGSTDRTTVFVTPDGQNAIVTAALQAQTFSAEMAVAALDPASQRDHLLLQGNLSLEATRACAQAAQARGVAVVLNPSPIAFDYSALWSLVDIVVANEEESLALTGEGDAERAAERLAEAGAAVVVVTRGSRDVLILDHGGERELAVRPVEAVDTTGAGDAFCGTLVAALDGGLDLDRAVERGVVVAGRVVRRPGAIASFPHAAEPAS